jgi:hypothetical protein
MRGCRMNEIKDRNRNPDKPTESNLLFVLFFLRPEDNEGSFIILSKTKYKLLCRTGKINELKLLV